MRVVMFLLRANPLSHLCHRRLSTSKVTFLQRGAESITANSNLAAPMTTSTSVSTATTTTTTAAGPSIVRIADEETELEVVPQREEQRIQDRLTRNNRNLAEYIRRAALEDERLNESRTAAPGGS